MLAALHHVQLAMPSGREAEARAFYGDLLGLDEVAKPPALARRGGAWFETGEIRVHLGVETPFRPARKAHPAFLVHDLAALRARFDAAGQGFTTDAAVPGFDRIYTDDPFGNRIELLEPTGDTGARA